MKAGFNEEISWRRFMVLVAGLPVDSAYQSWLRNTKNRAFASWDEGDIEEKVVTKKKRKGGGP